MTINTTHSIVNKAIKYKVYTYTYPLHNKYTHKYTKNPMYAMIISQHIKHYICTLNNNNNNTK